jgi:hypothetical protein
MFAAIALGEAICHISSVMAFREAICHICAVIAFGEAICHISAAVAILQSRPSIWLSAGRELNFINNLLLLNLFLRVYIYMLFSCIY